MKWANDMRIIADVLQDFGSKLDGYFQLGDLGAPPLHTAAHTRITGKLDKGPLIDIKLAVDEEGRLRAVRYKSAVGFPSSDTLMVTDATREQYEDFILDLFNIEK